MVPAFIMQDLLRAAHDMVVGHPALSADQICEDAFGLNDSGNPNKSKFTLYRELNPEDPGAKLGFLDLLRLMSVCGDYRPLAIMAGALGMRLEKSDAVPDKESVPEEIADLLVSAGEFADACRAPDVSAKSVILEMNSHIGAAHQLAAITLTGIKKRTETP